MQPLVMDPIERRKIQNRHAQRRFRSKKATQNAAKPLTTTSTPNAPIAVTGPTIKPRSQSTHDVLAWTGLATPPTPLVGGGDERMPHPNAAGRQISEHAQDPPLTTVSDSHTIQGKGDTAYLGPNATTTSLLRQFQDPLTPLSLRPSLQMNITDFNFPTFMNQPMRDPLQWSHDDAAEAMVFNTHDTGGFYSDNDTNNNAWSETGAVHQQFTSIAHSPSESSNDTSHSQIRITIPNLSLDSRPPQGLELENDEPFQTNLHIAAEAGHESLVSMLLGSGYSVDEPDSEGNTALHRASLGQHVKVMSKLLKHGANPNAMNVHGWTPVHMAFSLGSMEVVEVLVQHGGDLKKRARGKLSCEKFKEALAAKMES